MGHLRVSVGLCRYGVTSPKADGDPDPDSNVVVASDGPEILLRPPRVAHLRMLGTALQLHDDVAHRRVLTRHLQKRGGDTMKRAAAIFGPVLCIEVSKRVKKLLVTRQCIPCQFLHVIIFNISPMDL